MLNQLKDSLRELRIFKIQLFPEESKLPPVPPRPSKEQIQKLLHSNPEPEPGSKTKAPKAPKEKKTKLVN